MAEEIRLSKLMSQRGLCSRREADRLIEQSLVKVNGVVLNQLGVRVSEDAKVEVLKDGVQELESKMTIALNKPRGFVSSQPEKNYKSALELIRKNNYQGTDYKNFIRKGLAPLGRLDIDSTGLILYSQKGSLAKKIIGANSKVEKEYEVNITGGELSKDKVKLLEHGLELDGDQLRAAKVEVLSETFFKITLQQGKKRQIRRMCELVGLRTTRIHRVRVGNLEIGDLEEGRWKRVREEDIV